MCLIPHHSWSRSSLQVSPAPVKMLREILCDHTRFYPYWFDNGSIPIGSEALLSKKPLSERFPTINEPYFLTTPSFSIDKGRRNYGKQ